MFLVLLFLTLLHAVDCPGWQSGTVAMTRGGWTALPQAPASCRTHPVPTAVATAAVPAPAAPPLGRHQGPDPRAGRRVSIRPQPTRAPRPEAMALGPLWGRGAARAVARVPTRQWRVGGTARGTAAAAPRLPLPPGAAGVAAGGLPLPPAPPPPGRAGAWGEARGRALPVGGPAAAGGTPAPGTEGPLPRRADPGTHCSRVASRGPLSARGGLPAATNQGQRARQGGEGGDVPDRPGALLDTPGADGGGGGGGTSPGDSPPGVAPVSGPPTWLEGVYTPTAHEGAPGRGDGTGSPRGAGACPGSGTGPHAIVGGWRYSRGRSRRGTAAPPGAGRDQDGGRGTSPPPPPARPSPSPRPPPRGAADANEPGGQRGLPAPRVRGAGVARCPPPHPHSLPPAARPGPLSTCSSTVFLMARGPRGRGRGRGRRRGRGRAARAPPAPLTEHQRRHHGLALVRWWHRQAALVFPHRSLRWGWARTACAPGPPRRPAPRGPAAPGPAGRGLEWMVALQAPA